MARGMRLQVNQQAVRRLLQSTEMQRAVGRAAEDIASRVRTALPMATSSQADPYTGLTVRVDLTPNGGAKRDRAMATVVVEPPPAGDVRFPDRKLRFDVVARVAGEVSHR